MLSHKRATLALAAAAILVLARFAYQSAQSVSECESALQQFEDLLTSPAPVRTPSLMDALAQVESQRGKLAIGWAPWLRGRAASLDLRLKEDRRRLADRETQLVSLLDDFRKRVTAARPDFGQAASWVDSESARMRPPDETAAHLKAYARQLEKRDFLGARETHRSLEKVVQGNRQALAAIDRLAQRAVSYEQSLREEEQEEWTRRNEEVKRVCGEAFEAMLAALRVEDMEGALAVIDKADAQLQRPSYRLHQLREFISAWRGGNDERVSAILQAMKGVYETKDDAWQLENSLRGVAFRQRQRDSAAMQALRVQGYEPMVAAVRALVKDSPRGYFRDSRNALRPVIAGTPVALDISATTPNAVIADAPFKVPDPDAPMTVFAVIERKTKSHGHYVADSGYGALAPPSPTAPSMGPAIGETAIIAIIDWQKRQVLGWTWEEAEPPISFSPSNYGGRSGFHARVDMTQWLARLSRSKEDK